MSLAMLAPEMPCRSLVCFSCHHIGHRLDLWRLRLSTICKLFGFRNSPLRIGAPSCAGTRWWTRLPRRSDQRTSQYPACARSIWALQHQVAQRSMEGGSPATAWQPLEPNIRCTDGALIHRHTPGASGMTVRAREEIALALNKTKPWSQNPKSSALDTTDQTPFPTPKTLHFQILNFHNGLRPHPFTHAPTNARPDFAFLNKIQPPIPNVTPENNKGPTHEEIACLEQPPDGGLKKNKNNIVHFECLLGLVCFGFEEISFSRFCEFISKHTI